MGPKYGSKLGLIRQFLDGCDANAVVSEIRKNGSITVNLGGEDITFEEGDLLISTESKEGFVSASENGHTVVLDVNLTPELIDEGVVREVISKVQTMRKEAGFNVTDRITLYVKANDSITSALKKHLERISKIVLAEEVVFGSIDGYEKDWDVNGENVTLGVKKQ